MTPQDINILSQMYNVSLEKDTKYTTIDIIKKSPQNLFTSNISKDIYSDIKIKRDGYNYIYSYKQIIPSIYRDKIDIINISSSSNNNNNINKNLSLVENVELKEYLVGHTKDTIKNLYIPKQDTDLKKSHRIFHFSDAHLDQFFSPYEYGGKGVCHSPKLKLNINEKNNKCPLRVPLYTSKKYSRQGYGFGRYKCDPPITVFYSLLSQLSSIDSKPTCIIISGDITPHKYTGYNLNKVDKKKLEEQCPTNLLIVQYGLHILRQYFPNTPIIYTIGNVDHLPKEHFWRPYINKFVTLLNMYSIVPDRQVNNMKDFGSYYIDIDNTSLRIISLDLTIFRIDGGIIPDTDTIPTLKRCLKWLDSILEESYINNKKVIIVGHEPISGVHEDLFNLSSPIIIELKNILTKYSSIITVSLFGHRNLNSVKNIKSIDGTAIIPSITVAGISPRLQNNPSFNEIYLDTTNYNVLDFMPTYLDLLQENHKSRNFTLNTTSTDSRYNELYIGNWKRHNGKSFSWRSLTGYKSFTADTVNKFMNELAFEPDVSKTLERWKTGNFSASETPEEVICRAIHDNEISVKRCTFPFWNPKDDS